MASISQFWTKTPVTSINQTGDYFLVYSAANAAVRPINRNSALGITGSPVGTTDAQSISNKTISGSTLSAPVINGTITGTYTLGGTVTFPASVATISGTQSLSNKTLVSPVITGGSISNASIAVDAITGYTNATVVTVGGVQMSNGTINTAGAVVANAIAAGAIQPQALLAGTGSGWAWQAFTPALTNVTIADGTLSSRYLQVGKNVYYRGSFTLGGSSAVTGVIQIQLPVPINATGLAGEFPLMGRASVEDVGNAAYPCTPEYLSSTTFRLSVFVVSGSNIVNNSKVGAGTPITFGPGDFFTWYIMYEAA